MEIGNAEEMCVVLYSAVTCYWTADYLYDTVVAMRKGTLRLVGAEMRSQRGTAGRPGFVRCGGLRV